MYVLQVKDVTFEQQKMRNKWWACRANSLTKYYPIFKNMVHKKYMAIEAISWPLGLEKDKILVPQTTCKNGSDTPATSCSGAYPTDKRFRRSRTRAGATEANTGAYSCEKRKKEKKKEHTQNTSTRKTSDRQYHALKNLSTVMKNWFYGYMIG